MAYEETALKHDPEVTTAKVENKIDSLRVSYREALGFEGQTGSGTTLDGTTLRGKQLEKCPTFDRCNEVWGGKTNIAPLAPKDTLAPNPAHSPIRPPEDFEFLTVQ